MTTRPSQETETAGGGEPSEWVRAERDQARDRAHEAETIAEQLADDLAEARAEIARLKAALRPTGEAGSSFFSDSDSGPDHSRIADGSDPTVLPLALAGVTLVGVMVTLLSIINNGIISFATVVLLLITVGAGWGAWKTRVVGTVVEISAQGVVTVEGRGTSYRFDLSKPETQIRLQGAPGDPDWQVAFVRRTLDSCVVDATMVDPAEFVDELRRFRPEL